MLNANKLHEEVNNTKKDPKTWVRSKAAKDLIDECEEAYYESEGDDYKFSPLLAKHYAFYLNPLLVNENKKTSTATLPKKDEHWFDMIYDEVKKVMSEKDLNYVLHRSYELLFNVSYSYLNKELNNYDTWKASSVEVRQIISAFLVPIFVEYSCYKKPVDNFYLNRLISENKSILKQNLVFDRTRAIFNTDKFKIVLDNRLQLRKIMHEQ